MTKENETLNLARNVQSPANSRGCVARAAAPVEVIEFGAAELSELLGAATFRTQFSRNCCCKKECQMQAQAQRHRPVGVTILAVLAGIAFILNAFVTLVFLGAIPASLFGRTGFFGQALLGAILWGVLALIWGWVAVGLWNLNPQAWAFVVILCIIDLVFAFISLLGSTSLSQIIPIVVINVVILIYTLSPGVKEAFGVPEHPA